MSRLSWIFLLFATASAHAALELPAVATATPVSISTAAPAGVTLFTLQQCIERAVREATEVVKAKNALDVSGTLLLQAYFQFLPSLEASGGYSFVRGRNYFTQAVPSTIDTRSRGGSYQLAAGVNLFNGFADVAALESGTERRRAAWLALDRARQQIAFDVTQAYLQVLLDRELEKIEEGNLTAAREREKVIKVSTENGLRSLADLYRQQADTQANELRLIDAHNRSLNDLLSLLRRMRVDLLQPYDIAAVDLSTPVARASDIDPYALAREALSRRADLAAAVNTREADRWDVTTARGAYYPRLDVLGTLEGTGRILERQDVNGVSVVPPDQRSLRAQWGDQVLYTGGVALTWGIFNRYLTHVSVARAQERARNAAIDSQDLRLQVQAEVQQGLNNFNASILQIAASEKGLQAARESYTAVQARYQVGASGIVDLLTAQSALVQAQASHAQARIDYVLQDRNLALATGRLSPLNP